MSYDKEKNDGIRVVVNTILSGRYNSIVSSKNKNTKNYISPKIYRDFFKLIENLYKNIDGIVVTKNGEKLMDGNYKEHSAKYLHIAAEILYNKENKAKEDKEKALEYYKMAAELGNSIAKQKYEEILKIEENKQKSKEKVSKIPIKLPKIKKKEPKKNNSSESSSTDNNSEKSNENNEIDINIKNSNISEDFNIEVPSVESVNKKETERKPSKIEFSKTFTPTAKSEINNRQEDFSKTIAIETQQKDLSKTIYDSENETNLESEYFPKGLFKTTNIEESKIESITSNYSDNFSKTTYKLSTNDTYSKENSNQEQKSEEHKEENQKEKTLDDYKKEAIEDYTNMKDYIAALCKEAQFLEQSDPRMAVKYYKMALNYAKKEGGEYEFLKNNELENKIKDLNTIKINDEEEIDDYSIFTKAKTKLKKYGLEFEEELTSGNEATSCIFKDKNDKEIFVKIPKPSFNKEFDKEKENKKQMVIDASGAGSLKLIDEIDLDIKGENYKIEMYDTKDKDLSSALKDNNTIHPIANAMRLVSALKRLHNFGFVYADSKSANVLLDDNKKKLILCDFGTANLGEINCATGSPYYIAPESWNVENSVVTEKSDVYSSGFLLLEMFSGKNIQEVIKTLNNGVKITSREQLLIFKMNLNDNKIKQGIKNLINDKRLGKLFPGINLAKNAKIKAEIQKLISEFFVGVLKYDQNERFTSTDMMEKLAKIASKAKNIERKNGIKLDPAKNLHFRQKELHELGIIKEPSLKEWKENFKKHLEALITFEKPFTRNYGITKEGNCCLKYLLEHIKEEDFTINEDFKTNLETLKNKDEIEYNLVVTELNKFKRINIFNMIKKLKLQKKNLEKQPQEIVNKTMIDSLIRNIEQPEWAKPMSKEEIKTHIKILKNFYHELDLISKIKEDEKNIKYLLGLRPEDKNKFYSKTEAFEEALKINNISAARILLYSANNEERENMINDINVKSEKNMKKGINKKTKNNPIDLVNILSGLNKDFTKKFSNKEAEAIVAELSNMDNATSDFDKSIDNGLKM